jgi:hypothetical protein
MDVIRCDEQNILFGNGGQVVKPTVQKKKTLSDMEVV